MAKAKTVFFCSNCGAESARWIGNCPSCNEWNTYVEETIVKPKGAAAAKISDKSKPKSKPIAISDIQAGNTVRYATGSKELDRVLGGGLVAGSIILVGGQPGIGKSTLLLQLALHQRSKVMYVSGEESADQIKMRADRINKPNSSCYIYTEVDVLDIIKQANELQPQILIIDSIQTLSSPYIDSAAGSVSQVRECTAELQRFAKETNIPTFVIGHITKEGGIAGPKILEHIVDVVLQFEGDQHNSYRILRTLKNRFGSTEELGIYTMDATGLREVTNPSELLLSQNPEELSGSAIASTLEGQRPLMIETQALVGTAIYGTPQRSATGFDLRRLSMLLAVLEKRCGLLFGQKDVFLNMAGGIKVTDPAIDLAVVSSLISSLEDFSISKKWCFAGEIGLSGEIRPISRIEQRIQEADRLGFEKIFISKYNTKTIKPSKYNLEIVFLSKVDDLLREVFA